jgi:nicotinate-nucleotide pyrophosphorylase (carboxylating)
MTEFPAELCGRLDAAGLDPSYVAVVIAMALAEDLGGGSDVTTRATIPADKTGRADLVARASGVTAGLSVAEAVFVVVADGEKASPLTFTREVSDGDRVSAGQVLMTVEGSIAAILTAERTALNLVCHLSGIATLTRQWVDACSGTGARIRDTRKTLPGLRALEKYAVRCGGGVNHRMSLSDAALIKDNHVASAGSVTAAFDAVGRAAPGLPVEVECDTLDQVEEAVAAGAGLILLDNLSVQQLAQAVALNAGRALLEASGGLRLEMAAQVAATGVDFLSVGALTHSAPVLDVGLDLAAW